MPSPTKARAERGGLAASSSSTFSTLSAGSRPPQAWSMPSPAATLSATRCVSPLSITVRRTPAALSSRMASAEWGLTTSEMRMWPAYSPSMAMWMTVPALWHTM